MSFIVYFLSDFPVDDDVVPSTHSSGIVLSFMMMMKPMEKIESDGGGGGKHGA